MRQERRWHGDTYVDEAITECRECNPNSYKNLFGECVNKVDVRQDCE